MPDNDVTISSNDGLNDNPPPVQLFNEKPQDTSADSFIIAVSVSVSDFHSKVQAFTAYYKDTMIKLRTEKPEEWKKLLDNLKESYSKGNVYLDIAVELVAALTIEYEAVLQENGVGTEFSKALYEFKNNK